MVRIKLFGVLRLKTGFKETEANVSSVREACDCFPRHRLGWKGPETMYFHGEWKAKQTFRRLTGR